MRVTTYKTLLDEDRKTVLVKERAVNCIGMDSIGRPDQVREMLCRIFDAEKLAEEHLWLLALDTKCHLIGVFEISHGTVNAAITTPREVFVRLCLCGASGFILAHNHPSGDTTPSKEDVKLTEQMQSAGKLMGIQMLDHVIVGDGYHSMKEDQ